MTSISSTSTFPQINYPFVDDRGNITQPWLQVLLALYNRTGGSQGDISIILDTIDDKQGAILFRGSHVWMGLNAGPMGYVLETSGDNANPDWALRVKEIGTGVGLAGGPVTYTGTISMAQMPAFTLKGNALASLSDPADLTAADAKSFLRYIEIGDAAAGDLSGTYPDPTIALHSVSNAKLAQMGALTLKGNDTGVATDASDLTVLQVQTMLSGIVPGGAAGGDLSGNYPDPSVSKVNGTAPSTLGLSLLGAPNVPAVQDDLALVPGTNVFKQRTITGTSGQINVANGDGVSGDPTLSLDSDIIGAWTSYTPSVSSTSGSITSATATGDYIAIGKTILFSAKVVLTDAGTGGGALLIGLPVGTTIGAFVFAGREEFTTGKMIQALADSATAASAFYYDNSSPIATGNAIVISGSYQSS